MTPNTRSRPTAPAISGLDKYAREKRPFPKHETLAEKISGIRYEECHLTHSCKDHDCEECWYDSEDYWYDVGPGTPTVHEIRKWQAVQHQPPASPDALDIEKLKEYLIHRGTEFQKKNNYDASFECLYAVTVINQGWYWDDNGNKVSLRQQQPQERDTP